MYLSNKSLYVWVSLIIDGKIGCCKSKNGFANIRLVGIYSLNFPKKVIVEFYISEILTILSYLSDKENFCKTIALSYEACLMNDAG